ncbi:MAG: YbaB/EbfC family nucleoid-associated protein [Coriobacteriales bacterium]|jgi:DNA-binding YbaB/EbfC family protein|nr:YbaB/EbfC family nucleoid-associated protein [Coriobacteriales bacterium]
MAQMNMQKMMKQARKMQEEMEKAQEEAALLEATATAGGGMVKVVASGNGSIKSVSIARDVVDPDDVEMLEDLVLAATNEALAQAGELAQARMSAVTGGLNLPGF